MALKFSSYTLTLCPPLLIHILLHNINLLITYNYSCQLLLTRYQSYFMLCGHVYVTSWFGQLRTSSSAVHPLRMTTTTSSSLNVFYCGRVGQCTSCITCHKVDTGVQNLELDEALRHVSGVCEYIQSCSAVIFGINV